MLSRGKWVAACAVALGCALPATADAALLKGTLNGPNGKPLLTATLSSPLAEGLIGGNTQLLDGVGGLLCDPVTQVGQAVPQLPLGTAACALGALDFQWMSQLDGPNGPIVRTHAGLVNVPTPLNVDGDALPDVIGTVQVLALDRFTLRIDRVLGEVSTLPLKLEALIDDPTGALPRKRINAGYDARGARAPQLWSAVATLPEDGDDDLTTIEVEQTTVGGGTKLATVAGLFDGPATQRVDPIGGRVLTTAPPPTLKLGLSLGRFMEVRAGASVPTLVNAAAEIVEGAAEQRIGADIVALPQSLAVRYEQPGTDQRTVTYTASAVVPQVDATYRELQAGVLQTKAVVKAKLLPTGMTVEQTSAKAGTFQATGGTLGSVEVGYANGEPKLLAVDHPYARVFDDGTLSSFAGRIDDLQAASADLTDDVRAELQLGAGPRKPFRALLDQPGRHVDGTVSDLPRHIKLLVDPDGGRVDYDAFGETIGQIDVEATQTAPFFGRVTRIDGTIKQLPSQATVDIRPDSGGLKLQTNNPIGEAEALLTSGPSVSVPAFGAKVEDLPSHFAAFARVKGLKLVDLHTGPNATDPVKAQVQLGSTPLRVEYDKAGLSVDADLSPVPSDVTVAFDPGAGTVNYDGNAGIGSIDATVVSDTPLFGRVTEAVARIEGLPQSVDVGFKPASGSGATVVAEPAVGMVQALLSDGTGTPPVLAAGESGAVMRDLPSAFSLFARVYGVQEASFTQAGGNLTARLRTTQPQDLKADVQFDTPGDAIAAPAKINATVEDLPTDLTLKTTGAKVEYLANATVPKVTLSAFDLPGDEVEGAIHHVTGTLTGVPSQFTIRQDLTKGVEANGPFERVDLEAWDAGPANPAFPEDGRNKVQLNTRDGRLHVQARAFALQKVLLTQLVTTKVETAFGTPTPAGLDLDVLGGTGAEPLDLDVLADDLPQSSTFTLDQISGTEVGWGASDGDTDIKLLLSSKDVGTNLDLTDLPGATTVCIGSGPVQCDAESQQFPLMSKGFDSARRVPLFNDLTVNTVSDGTIRMSGTVCSPPTDDEGEGRTGDVYGGCITDPGGWDNRVEISDLRIRTTKLELSSGYSDDEGEPYEDDLLKLFLKSDSDGIRVGNLRLRNDTSDSTTRITAGDPPLRHRNGPFFFGLFDLTTPPDPEDEPRVGQLECGDLDVFVDLPLLGATDVLPGLGEVFLGDICA